MGDLDILKREAVERMTVELNALQGDSPEVELKRQELRELIKSYS